MAGAHLLFVAAVAVVCGAAPPTRLPSYVIPCSKLDPDLNKCVLEHGRQTLKELLKIRGDRKYGIPNLLPLSFPKIHSDNNGLNLTFIDVKLFGLQDVKITKAMADLKKRHHAFELFVPRLEIICDYEVSGRILLLPIRGNGPANITIPNLKVLASQDFALRKGKSGKEFMSVMNASLVILDNPSGIIRLDNLFGNKELSDNMNVVLNDNSVEVIKDVGPAIAHAIGLVLHGIVGNLVSIVPFDEVYPAVAA